MFAVSPGIKVRRSRISLDELLPADHVSRVIAAVVARLDLGKFGFAKASAAATGRPSCDPANLLKFYVSGYLQQVRSSRLLEAECRRLRHWRADARHGAIVAHAASAF